ncbi:MAG: type II toxin-antitoxin system Phd/YefM family antitoxin [Acidimicrobiales bacterium]
MRRIGIREFKDHATAYLSGGETLVIEKRGKPVGFYVPIEAKDRKAGQDALRRLGDTVGAVLAETGLSEDDLVKELAPRRQRRSHR